MQRRPASHPLDGRDRACFKLDWKQEAAQLWLAVDQHRAGAAFAQLAPMLCPVELHVFTQDLEQGLVHREQQLCALTIYIERDDMAVDGPLYLVPQDAPSIVRRTLAHAHRSGATASARLDVGTGSSGWTRMVRMPSASAGMMSFSSLLPITTHRPGSAPEARIAISKTAGCGLRRPASFDVTMASTFSAMPMARQSSLHFIRRRPHGLVGS